MKTRHAYLWALLFMTAGLFSCTEKESLEEQLPLKEVSIFVDQKSYDGGETRAVDTGFKVGESIGIFAVLHQNGELKSSGNVADNKKWTLKEVDGVKQWLPDTDADKIYYKESDEKLDFYAYYPYSETVTNPLEMRFAVKTDQSEGFSSSDFMVASNTRGLWRGPVSLQFAHKLSRLELTVVRVLNTSSTNNELKATANVPVTDYTCNLQTGAITTNTATTASKAMKMQQVSINDGDNVTSEIKYLYYLILPPQEIPAAKNCFQFKLDGRDYNGKMEAPVVLTTSKRTSVEMMLNFNPIFSGE